MFKKKPTRKELEKEIELLKGQLEDLQFITLTKNKNSQCDFTNIMCSNCKHAMYGKVDGVKDKFICDININCENFDQKGTDDCYITVNKTQTEVRGGLN